MVPGNGIEAERSLLGEGIGGGELSLTLTGNSLTAPLPPSRPALYNLRQPKTWLALTPCARATLATDAPSAIVSSTIRRFSSTVRSCRFGPANGIFLAMPVSL